MVPTVLVAAGLLSVHMKQDDNWDLQNYHIYNAFSLVGGRLGTDLWADQQQITFDPLLDLPYYMVARVWLGGHPRWVAFLAGLPFGALVLVAGCLNAVLFGRPRRNTVLFGRPRRNAVLFGRLRRPMPPLALIATVLGAAGTTVISEIGTTFGDIPVACLVLLGVTALLVSVRDARYWWQGCVVAGSALGLAAGLKLTAVLYLPAAIVAVLCSYVPDRRVRAGAIFAVAWLAAFAPPVCWWGWHLQRAFGSPVFPLLNSLFASPWAPATNSLDSRFLPRDLAQWLFYPFFWLRGQTFRASEGPVQDAHFACAYLSMFMMLAGRYRSKVRMPPERTLLLVFFVTAYALWEVAFSILRYAMPLEVLTGTVVVLAIDLAADAATAHCWLRSGVLAAVPLAMLALQSPYDAGRLKRYGRTTFDIAAPPLPDRAAIAFLGRPTSFVAPFLSGHALVFVGLGGERAMTPTMAGAMLARLSAAPSVFALVNRDSAAGRHSFAGLGWTIDDARCRSVVNPFQSGILLCPASRAGG